MENKIFELLKYIESNGYEAFIVGGYVRDRILGKKTTDIDICTSAKPEELKEIIPNLKYKNFYCSYLKINDFDIEITTYRKDENYDGRKPQLISYAKDLKEDLFRRDFTINTICLNSSGQYIDLFNGIADLNNKIIKSVGNSDIKIKEDNLRILRAIRLASILNFKLSDELEQSITKNSKLVSNLSSYRIKSEFDKILNNNNFKYGIMLLKKFNIDKYLNIEFLNDINYCNNLIGMYSQININRNDFFKSSELKKINILKKYINNKIDVYSMYDLGKDNINLLEQITCKSLMDDYEKLPIKNEKELKISYKDIQYLLKAKNIKFSDVKKDIIKQILNNVLVNENKFILDYINNKY